MLLGYRLLARPTRSSRRCLRPSFGARLLLLALLFPFARRGSSRFMRCTEKLQALPMARQGEARKAGGWKVVS